MPIIISSRYADVHILDVQMKNIINTNAWQSQAFVLKLITAMGLPNHCRGFSVA